METIIDFKSEVLPYADGHRGELTVKLGDFYKTGNIQFSIRVRSEAEDSTGRWFEESWGMNELFIENRFEDLLPLVGLHGCCVDGAPLRPVAEGSYLLRHGRLAEAKKLLRITNTEVELLLIPAYDPQYFSYMLRRLGIVERWADEARRLLQWMDFYTENKRRDDFGNPPELWDFGKSKSDYHNIDFILETIKADEEAGEYTPEKIIARKNERWMEAVDKERNEITAEYEHRLKTIEREREIRLSILEAGIISKNFIIYEHDKSVSFNWTYSLPLIPEEDIERFVEEIASERFQEFSFRNEKIGSRKDFMDK